MITNFKLKYYISKLTYKHIEDVYNYFSETTLRTLKEKYDFDEPGIVWDDNTTLEQVFKYVTKQNPIYKKSIYKLYELIHSQVIDAIDYYDKIPEGIVELDFNQINKTNYERFKERCINADISLPSSLKKLVYGNFFRDANVLTLYVNKELEILKHNESDISIKTIELKENNHKKVFMHGITVQLPKETDFMYDNKCINHIVIPSNSKFFDNEENILDLCDYYISLPTESFSRSFNCYYIGYLHSIPKFKCFSFVVGEQTYVYDPKVIEKELSEINWGYGNVDNEYLLNKVCRYMLIMLPDKDKNEKAPSLAKKLTPPKSQQ